MVKKNTTTKKKEEKTKKSEGKKVTVGAWWKSTVIKESSDGEAVEPITGTEKAPQKRKGRKPSPKSSRTTAVKASARKQGKTAEEKPKPARKSPPGRKTSTAPAQDPSASEVDVLDIQTVPESPEPLPRKPQRKRSPRKRAAETIEAAVQDDSKIKKETGIEETEDKISELKPKKKTPRRRAPRKPKQKAKEKAVEASPAVEKAQAVEQSVVTTVKSEEVREKPALPVSQGDDDSRDDSDDTKEVETQTGTDVEAAEVEKTEQPKIQKAAKVPKPVIKLLINAEEPEECRLALLEDGRLESIHVATVTRAQTKNNIYKAKIVAIEANLQAAFVEYGTDKNGFLPFSEIHPEYYRQDVNEKTQKLIDQHQWKRLSIKDVVERGQEVLVQVVKEEVGSKGANMTTYLSLPGRCVVLMPGSDSTGISRKISGEERRGQLRDYVKSFDIPEGIGWIVRTASIDITKTALSRDVGYLLRLWEDVKKKGQELNGVGLIYQDHNHVLRFLREHFDPDIQEILVDDKESLEQVKEFVALLPSRQRNVRVKLHRGERPIFNQYSIEDQIESIYQPRVNLPSGGSIVIDPTEALVAIDVNSGSTSKGQNFEASIFQANMEAAKELARQLRLRDLGGLIVVDFIDMRANKNIREVERQVKTAMKRDKAKVDISRISKFGLMQISRQKLGAPIEAGNYRVCTHCKGRGMVRSVETLALYYLRRIHTGATRKVVNQIECHFPLDVAQYLLNYKRNELRDLESKYDAEVIIIAEPSFKPADNDIIFHKAEKDDPAKKRS